MVCSLYGICDVLDSVENTAQTNACIYTLLALSEGQTLQISLQATMHHNVQRTAIYSVFEF